MVSAGKISLFVSLFVAVVITTGGLTPSKFAQGPIRLDGPYLQATAFVLFVASLVSVLPRRWFRIVVAADVFVGAVEGLRSFFDRAPEWSDMLANTLSALAGVLFGVPLSKRATRRP